MEGDVRTAVDNLSVTKHLDVFTLVEYSIGDTTTANFLDLFSGYVDIKDLGDFGLASDLSLVYGGKEFENTCGDFVHDLVNDRRGVYSYAVLTG